MTAITHHSTTAMMAMGAEEVPFGTKWETVVPASYIRDTVYSPELGIYVAVGNSDLPTNPMFSSGASGANSHCHFFTSTNAVDWTFRQTFSNSTIAKVIWANSQFVAIGSSGRIITSSDGFNWVQRTSNSTRRLLDIVWSGNLFVVVGQAGTVITSPDGITWTSQTTNTFRHLDKIIWDGSKFTTCSGLDSSSVVGVCLYSTDGITWNFSRSGSSAHSVAYSSELSLYVACGIDTFFTSTNGNDWIERKVFSSNYLMSKIVWNGTIFVAVGPSNFIFTSPDGINWTSRPSGLSRTLNSVVWSGTQFVAVGTSGAILTSPDGTTWTVRTSSVTSLLTDVVWTGTQFVAVGYVGATGEILTSPDGITWTVVYSMLGVLVHVAWNGSLLVAVGNQGIILTSSNGTSWTSRTSNTTTNLRNIVWRGPLFYCVSQTVSSSGNLFFYSFDGISWSSITRKAGGTPHWHSLTYIQSQMIFLSSSGISVSANMSTWVQKHTVHSGYRMAFSPTLNRYVLIGVSSTNVLYTSSDGINWGTGVTTPNSDQRVEWVGDRFISCGPGKINTSPDGITWTSYTITGNPFLTQIARTNSRYIVAGGGSIVTSIDGTNWSRVSMGAGNLGTNELTNISVVNGIITVFNVDTSNRSFISLDGVNWNTLFPSQTMGFSLTYSPELNLIVAVGQYGTILVSSDATKWTEVSRVTGNTLNGVTWNGTKFIAVGQSGTILTSTDGFVWLRETPTISDTLYNVTWENSQFLISASNAIFTSPNGGTWTKRNSPKMSELRDTTFGNSIYVSVGTNGTILTSPDGVTWTSRTSNVTNALYNVLWTGTQFIAVGMGGTILTSPDGVTWTSRTSGVPNLFYSIEISPENNLLLIIGFDCLLTSADGITWTLRTAVSPRSYNCLLWVSQKSKFIAMGTSGETITCTKT